MATVARVSWRRCVGDRPANGSEQFIGFLKKVVGRGFCEQDDRSVGFQDE